MSRPVGMSLKAAGMIMIGSLVLGVIIGLVIPQKETSTTFSAAATSLRGGAVDRRLVEFNNLVQRVENQEGEKALVTPDSDATSDPKAEWPHHGLDASGGDTLWGSNSEDDIWIMLEKLWQSQDGPAGVANDFATAESYDLVLPETYYSLSYMEMDVIDSEEVEIGLRRSLRDSDPSPFDMDAIDYWDLELFSAYSFSFEYL